MLQRLLERAESATDGAGRTFWMWIIGFIAIAPPGSALDSAIGTVFALLF